MHVLSTPALLIILLFTFGSSIFYILLLIERHVWTLARTPQPASIVEDDVRFVHRILKHLIPVLPPSNGVVVVGGLASLLWQGAQLHWSWPSLVVLGYWIAGQGYIIVFGRIARAIKDVRATSNSASIGEITRGVRGLLVQHRNGLIHATGVLVLELVFVLQS